MLGYPNMARGGSNGLKYFPQRLGRKCARPYPIIATFVP
jgi:hypothetical protein